MSGITRFLVGPGIVGTMSSSSATPSGGSNAAHARTVQKIHWNITTVAGTVMLLSGYQQGLLSRTMGEYKSFDNPASSVHGSLTIVYCMSCSAGALAACVLGDYLGRKTSLWIATMIMATAFIVQMVARSPTPVVLATVMLGIGNGANTATAPVWHVETSTQNAKGEAVAKEMIASISGFIIARLMITSWQGLNDRMPLFLPVILAVMILFKMWSLPESPRWLFSRARHAEAKDILASLRVNDCEAEYHAIRQSGRVGQHGGTAPVMEASPSRSSGSGQATRRAFLGVLLQICQQMTGINLFLYSLMPVFHQRIGFSALQSRYATTVIAVLYLLAAIRSRFVIERYGRRQFLMSGAAAQCVALIGVAISTQVSHELVSAIIAVICIMIYTTAVGLCWLTVPWLYPVEVNGLRRRTKGAALATACGWAFSPLAGYLWHTDVFRSGGIYLIFAVLNAVIVLLVYFLVIETAGKSLEEMDRLFEINPGWLVHNARYPSPASGLGTVNSSSAHHGTPSEGEVQPLLPPSDIPAGLQPSSPEEGGATIDRSHGPPSREEEEPVIPPIDMPASVQSSGPAERRGETTDSSHESSSEEASSSSSDIPTGVQPSGPVEEGNDTTDSSDETTDSSDAATSEEEEESAVPPRHIPALVKKRLSPVEEGSE